MSNPLAEPTFEPIRPLKRSEYDRMVELGMFDDERLELLEGVLVTLSPQKASHARLLYRGSTSY